MNIKKIIKLSFIGGSAGAIETLIAYISSFFARPCSIVLDFIMSGLFFTIVGAGIMMSFFVAMPQLKEKKTKLFVGGIIGGFCAGLFYHFLIGIYIGIFVLSLSLAIVIMILRMPNALRVLFGGILGGYGSVFLMSISVLGWSFIDPMQNHLFMIPAPTLLSTAINIYFIDFGMLVGLLSKQHDR